MCFVPGYSVLRELKRFFNFFETEVFVYTTQKTSIYLEHQKIACGGVMRIQKLEDSNEVHFGTISHIYSTFEPGVMLVEFFEFSTKKVWPIVLVDTTICKKDIQRTSYMFKHI